MAPANLSVTSSTSMADSTVCSVFNGSLHRIAVCVGGMALLMTRVRRSVALGMLMLAVSACSHRIRPAAPAAPPVLFTATAYCTNRLTASGVPVAKGVVAADPAVLPLGTVIRIRGAASYDGTYRVLDTGLLIRRRRVDVYIADCAEARRFGRRSVQVTVMRSTR